MIDLGITRSTVRPQDVEVTESKVLVASNIHEVTVTMEDETVTEFEFNYLEYTKDEYIHLLSDRNTQLEQDVLNTQMGLIEVYELIVG